MSLYTVYFAYHYRWSELRIDVSTIVKSWINLFCKDAKYVPMHSEGIRECLQARSCPFIFVSLIIPKIAWVLNAVLSACCVPKQNHITGRRNRSILQSNFLIYSVAYSDSALRMSAVTSLTTFPSVIEIVSSLVTDLLISLGSWDLPVRGWIEVVITVTGRWKK